MKRYFSSYIILFLSLPSLCSAQKIYFTDPGNFWRVKETYTFASSQPQYFYYDFWYGADTTIGSTIYKKILCSDSSRGYVREDTTAKLVFYYNTGTASEDTLYNYNLSYGDTIAFHVGSYNFYDRRSFFQDSVQINGIYYKYFALTCANCAINHPFDRTYAVMAGVGSFSGPLFPTSLGACEVGVGLYSFDLQCFSENNIAPVFNSTTYSCNGSSTFSNTSTCGPTGINGLLFTGNSLRVYPNPVKEHLTIETNIGNTILNHIRILDISGREVYSAYINGSMTEVDMSNFAEGIYFVELVSRDGYKNVRRIIKV